MNEEEMETARAFVACSRWVWLPGMRAVGRKGYPAAWFRVEEPLQKLGGVWRGAVPDLTDPATLGCILQVARDAHGVPWLTPVPLYHALGCYGWRLPIRIDGAPMHRTTRRTPVYKSEAEALLQVLQAAPEAPND